MKFSKNLMVDQRNVIATRKEMGTLQAIRQHPDCSITKIVHSCGIGYYKSMEILKNLEEQGLVQKRENSITRNNFLRGRPATVYTIC